MSIVLWATAASQGGDTAHGAGLIGVERTMRTGVKASRDFVGVSAIGVVFLVALLGHWFALLEGMR